MKNNETKPKMTIDDGKRFKMIFATCGVEDINKLEEMTNRDIYKKLHEKYNNISTLEVLLYTLKKHFMIKNWDKTRLNTLKIRDVKFWHDVSRNATAELYNEELKQNKKGDEIVNWKTHEELMEIRENIKDKTSNEYLLLSCCLLTPPLRNNFYCTVRYARRLKDMNKTDNYIFLNYKTKKCMYIVNDDKVSKRHTKYKTKEYTHIPINNDELNKIIFETFEKNPRTYLFETNKNTPYTTDTIRTVLLARKYNLTFDILRSSYITYIYNKDPNNIMLQTELAKAMRHDRETAILKYFKKDANNIINIDTIYRKLNPDEEQFLKGYILSCSNPISDKT